MKTPNCFTYSVLTLNLIPDLGKVLTVGFLLGSYVKISSMIPLWSMRYHLTEWRVSWELASRRKWHSKVTSSLRLTNLGTLNWVMCRAVTQPEKIRLVLVKVTLDYKSHLDSTFLQWVDKALTFLFCIRVIMWNTMVILVKMLFNWLFLVLIYLVTLKQMLSTECDWMLSLVNYDVGDARFFDDRQFEQWSERFLKIKL